MQFHVLRELRRPIGATTQFTLEEPSFCAEGILLSGVSGTVTLLRTDKGLLVSVDAYGIARDQCSRCLAEIACAVEIHFQEEYIPVFDPNTGLPVHLDEESDEFRIPPDFMLDLREGLRQYILMSRPAKPLCREDCAGLCPECGADLNQGICGCAHNAGSRWQTLTALKTSDSEGS